MPIEALSRRTSRLSDIAHDALAGRPSAPAQPKKRLPPAPLGINASFGSLRSALTRSLCAGGDCAVRQLHVGPRRTIGH
jgi:hypothetical protein